MKTVTYGNPVGKIPAHLPKRLTISFPIWGLMETGHKGAYADWEQLVKEHVERGFNCIRLESGAGLTHDLEGNRLPPANIHAPFGKFSNNRQAFCIGGEGPCDFLQRLIDLCTACKKYDVYVILSSWYYLHTYWYVDESFNEKYYALPPKDRFMAFAKFLHYILKELEDRGLSDRIASAEIFNEVCDLPALWSCAGEDLEEIKAMFRAEHEKALAFLQENHPDILFSCDHRVESEPMDLYPRNMQAFNGHNYFLWDIYAGTLEGKTDVSCSDFFQGKYTAQDVIDSRIGRFFNYSYSWNTRLCNCHDLDPTKIPALEQYLEQRLQEKWDEFTAGLEHSCEEYQKIMAAFPEVPILCGEGISYCSHKEVLWEERSEKFWEIVALAMRRYKEIGLWGSVIKTCCGPEDPCWNLCKDKLRALNEEFLREN